MRMLQILIERGLVLEPPANERQKQRERAELQSSSVR